MTDQLPLKPSYFERQRAALTAELDYMFPIRGNAFGHQWEHHVDSFAEDVDPDGEPDAVVAVARECWQVWQAEVAR